MSEELKNQAMKILEKTPEFVAMYTIEKVLEEFSSNERDRIVSWISAKGYEKRMSKDESMAIPRDLL